MSSIRSHIANRLDQVKQKSEKQLVTYKQGLLTQLKTNLQKTERHKDGTLKTAQEKIEDNQGLITRYKTARPHPFNQMQQAFAEAKYV